MKYATKKGMTDSFQPPRIAVFSGSIRQGRTSLVVAKWAMEELSTREDAVFELIDLAEHDIPPLTDAIPPSAQHGQYSSPQANAWAQIIGSFDGFIFATPEYNASIPGTMKNAFDTLFDEWGGKPVGFLGWGGNGALTSIQHWQDVVTRARMIPIKPTLHFFFRKSFPNRVFTPSEEHRQTLHTIADTVVATVTTQQHGSTED